MDRVCKDRDPVIITRNRDQAVVMLSFFSALSRYQVDFMPAFMVLAVVGLLATERWLAPRARTIAGGAVAIAASYGVIFGVLFSLQFDGLLREHSPALERRVAEIVVTLHRFANPALGKIAARYQ